jgi:hypothetical protein
MLGETHAPFSNGILATQECGRDVLIGLPSSGREDDRTAEPVTAREYAGTQSLLQRIGLVPGQNDGNGMWSGHSGSPFR